MISAVVLAAGQGKRMGKTKQLLSLGKSTIIGQVVQTLLEIPLDQVIVVLGYQAEQVAKELDESRITWVYNSEYAAGQSTSLQRGILATSPQTSGYLLVLGDQPFVQVDTFKQLLAQFSPAEKSIVVPYYQGVRGNPVLFPASLKEELIAVNGDQGARRLLQKYPELVKRVSVEDPGILQDIDTWEDYCRLREVNQDVK